MGRLLGIDYGRKRIGLAVTDPLKIIATPLTTLNHAEFEIFIKNYVQSEDVEAFIIGNPVKLDNTAGETAHLMETFIRHLGKLYPDIPLYRVDERYTSVIAHQAIIDCNVKKNVRQDKKLVDKISATLILQSFMRQKENK